MFVPTIDLLLPIECSTKYFVRKVHRKLAQHSRNDHKASLKLQRKKSITSPAEDVFWTTEENAEERLERDSGECTVRRLDIYLQDVKLNRTVAKALVKYV